MKEKRVILLVSVSSEDRKEIREALEEEKNDREYEILEAAGQTEAFAMLADRVDIDIIFLDIILPETGGLEFLTDLKRDKKLLHIPVIVNTQPGKNSIVEQALVLGADDFVPRPYRPEIIRTRVGNVLNRTLHDRDRLTKLYTAPVFYTQTKKMLLENPDQDYAILYFNIKGFTLLNDYYGSRQADKILQELAQLFREIVGESGTYGRIISDNFVCCVPSTDREEELLVEKYIESGSNDLRRQYHFDLECGIYKIDERDIEVSQMCDRAKFALMAIKSNLGEHCAYYNAAAAVKYRLEQRLTSDMAGALKDGQFFIMIQPIYEAVTEQPIGAEALVRWRHPELGIISPGIFVPLFEKNGFIRSLDMFVWEEVCKLQSGLKAEGCRVNPISVNVSRIDLYKPGLADAIEELLNKYQVTKEELRLEITESAYTEKPQEIIDLTANLRERGFKLLMGDFGSGYSSLNMLKEMPIDTLKIDMQFMEELESSQRAGNILISIVRMAKMLKINTVAEGVETKDQLEFLRNVGCDRIQGFYFSKPVSVEEYRELIKAENRKKEEYKPVYKKGVLLVDDVTMLRKSLMNALGDDYQYYEAVNGREALEILQSDANRINIIITDIFMPEMDGFELIRELQGSSVYAHIPIIVITASEERESEIKALELGAVDVVTKPYDSRIVSQRVKNVMKLSEIEWLQMGMRMMRK